MTLEWFERAACHGMGRRWHHLHWSHQRAKCATCPVKNECWDLCCSSFETWSADGTWAGTTANEREAIGCWTEIRYHPPRRPTQ